MGKLYVVATPIGNLSDVSFRQIEILKSVDLILCEDTRQSIKLLNHYDIKNKLVSYHKFNEEEKSGKIIEELKKDKNIALISDAGTPLISDPGYVITKMARENNIEVIGIPGPSAVVTALSISGFEVNNFAYYGFFPREEKDKKELIKKINKSDINLFVFYESPKRIKKTLKYLQDNINDLDILVCSDLTKLHEKCYFGPISNVIKELNDNPNSELGEYTFIIRKHNITTENVNTSIEAMLVDIMIKENVNIKEAINILKEKTNLSKKDIYNASLNLKKYFWYWF